MSDINHLLKKYNGYVPGEMRSKEYEQKKKQRQRNKEKHKLVDEIGVLMFLRDDELNTVHYLVNKFTNFKKLHGKASNRAIVAALCFTFVRIRNPSARVSDYKACTMNGLSSEVLSTVQSKIISGLLASAPIVPVASGKYDHNVLCSQSLRQAESTSLD